MPLFSTENNFLSTIDNQSASGILHLTNTTDSTDVSSGALVLDGGLAVSKNIYSSGTIVNNGIVLNQNGDFTIGGTSDAFYPVLFRAYGNSPSQVYPGRLRLQLYRSNIHDNASSDIFVSTFDLIFAFLSTNYGNSPSLINEIQYFIGEGTYDDPVADIQDCTGASGTNEVAIWLTGGLTYAFRSPDSGAYWACYNANSDGGSIVDSSGITLNPTTTQSDLILRAKRDALNTAPTSSSAAGSIGEIRSDSNYIYVCTDTNTWKRASISSW